MLLDLLLAALATLHGPAAYAMVLLLLTGGGVGAPWSQDVLLLAAAGQTLQAGLQPIPAMLAAWLGILAGDTLGLWAGRHYGARWVRRPWAARFVPPQRLPALEAGMRRHAAVWTFVTRFLPGQRASLFFIAGTLGMSYRSFFLADAIAAVLQVVLFFFGVRSLGWNWQALAPRFDRADDLLTAALLLVLLVGWLRVRRQADPGS